MAKVSIHAPLTHYVWGAGCDGWNLVDTKTLSVKQERMPPATTEACHYHNSAQQFFYILSGTARFDLVDEVLTLAAGEGVHIVPGVTHCIRNTSASDLHFLVCSQPATATDRINFWRK